MTRKNLDTKLIALAETAVKSVGEDGVFEGWVSQYGHVDSYGDRIVPGAYTETLKSGRSVSMYWNHQYRLASAPARIGIWESFEERPEGLWGKGRLTLGHPLVAGIIAALKAGTLSGLSIGYRVAENGFRMVDGVRELVAIQLEEVSIVDDPADDYARISLETVKSLQSVRDVEAALRDVGLSQTEAKTLISRLREILTPQASAPDPAAEALAELKRIYSRNPAA